MLKAPTAYCPARASFNICSADTNAIIEFLLVYIHFILLNITPYQVRIQYLMSLHSYCIKLSQEFPQNDAFFLKISLNYDFIPEKKS
ncbi:hypothetical protein FM106_01895 [Brachybacterium faecium]|nr:hypothetical protein FM106_01895 [Brachybacterium faecium]